MDLTNVQPSTTGIPESSMAVAPQPLSTEKEQVDAARRGDRRAFEMLYRSHVGRIFALCLRLEGDRDEAELLVQDAFVQAWRKLDRFRGQSTFGTWLHRLTVNLVLDRKRADQRRNRREVATDLEENTAAMSATTAPERVVDRLELERAIAALPEGARMVFVLKEIEGYPTQDIADRLGVAEGTIKAQAFRARRMLREALK